MYVQMKVRMSESARKIIAKHVDKKTMINTQIKLHKSILKGILSRCCGSVVEF
jgi:hypothetical protein